MGRCLVLGLTLAAFPLAAHGAEITVRMKGADYAPATLEARVGDRLVFVNDGAVDHEVFVPTAGHGVDLGKQAPGTTAVLPLGKSGRFEVECVIHPHMHLAVRVRE
jgi:plastocyanin